MENYFDDEDLRPFFKENRQKAKGPKMMGDFTKFLIVSCVIIFFLSMGLSDDILKYVLFNSENILKYPWILVSNAFFHANFMHLFLNLWGIFMFGSFLELRRGTDFMVKLFFSSVIFSNLVFGFFNPGVYGIGISGFVFALIGSVVVFEPNTMIFIFPLPVPMKISIIGPIFLVISIVLAFTASDGVGHIAHAAGFVMGYALSKYYASKKINFYYGK